MSVVMQVLAFFGNYTPIIAFFGAIIGGEETLVLLSILAAQGHLVIWSVFVFFFLGIIVSDFLWYFLGKSRLFDWLVQKRFISKVYLHWDNLLNKSTRGSDLQALFMTKFLYGLRITTIMYLARERIKIRSFFIYSIITNFVWAVIIMVLGLSAGKGISLATNITDNITLYLILIGISIFLFALGVRLLSDLTKKWLAKK